jgi:hypothetical protein
MVTSLHRQSRLPEGSGPWGVFFLEIMAKRLIQYNLFDEPTVKRITKGRHRPAPWETREKHERLEVKRKLQMESEFESYWKERGLIQGYMFDEEGNATI